MTRLHDKAAALATAQGDALHSMVTVSSAAARSSGGPAAAAQAAQAAPSAE
jgi:hypothetical protein